MDKRIPLYIVLAVLVVVAVILFFIFPPASQIPARNYCSTDSDCASFPCCHPNEAVNIYYKPDCSAVICTASCDGPLDCGAGRIECIENKCAIVPNT